MVETFGERLRRLRIERGMTQADVATRLSISRQAVVKWENLDGEPRAIRLKAICRLFRITLDELLAGY